MWYTPVSCSIGYCTLREFYSCKMCILSRFNAYIHMRNRRFQSGGGIMSGMAPCSYMGFEDLRPRKVIKICVVRPIMNSGVTRVGVTRRGNWWCHLYFFLEKLTTFLVSTVCQFYNVTPIFFLRKLTTFCSSLYLCHFVRFHSGVTSMEGVTPDLFSYPTSFVHCSL